MRGLVLVDAAVQLAQQRLECEVRRAVLRGGLEAVVRHQAMRHLHVLQRRW